MIFIPEQLHGVPMTIKESFNVAGLHTTWGNPAFKDFVADADATVPRRLEQAGAIIVGKTNVAFMLGDFAQTANQLYGVTSNPWDTTRTPGGSSGGAAAALSAGMTFLEYGSDLVGSIRIPASFCGVYGLKPSTGIVPLTGFQPPGPPAGPSDMTYMSAVGPLGRSARDLRTALRVTAGPEDQAAKAYSWALSPPRHRRLEDFRVGVVLDHQRAPVSSEVTAPLLRRRRRVLVPGKLHASLPTPSTTGSTSPPQGDRTTRLRAVSRPVLPPRLGTGSPQSATCWSASNSDGTTWCDEAGLVGAMADRRPSPRPLRAR